MNRLDGFTHTLDEPIVVGKGAVNFGKRGSRENHIGERSCVSFEKFLHHQKFKFA